MSGSGNRAPNGNRAPLAMGEQRFRSMGIVMRLLFGAAALLTLATALAPEEISHWTGWGAVGLIVAAPLVRVLWFSVRWSRRGDIRFALVALGVLMMAALGFLLG